MHHFGMVLEGCFLLGSRWSCKPSTIHERQNLLTPSPYNQMYVNPSAKYFPLNTSHPAMLKKIVCIYNTIWMLHLQIKMRTRNWSIQINNVANSTSVWREFLILHVSTSVLHSTHLNCCIQIKKQENNKQNNKKIIRLGCDFGSTLLIRKLLPVMRHIT